MDVDRFRELVDLDLQLVADDAERRGIDGDALHFHADEDGQQRAFDVVEDGFLTGFGEERADFLCELESDIGILGGVFRENGERDGADVEVLG